MCGSTPSAPPPPPVLPEAAQAQIRADAWSRPEIFNCLQEKGGVADSEMLRTFNCGIGMILCVSAEQTQQALDILNKDSDQAFLLGSVASRDSDKDASVVML